MDIGRGIHCFNNEYCMLVRSSGRLKRAAFFIHKLLPTDALALLAQMPMVQWPIYLKQGLGFEC